MQLQACEYRGWGGSARVARVSAGESSATGRQEWEEDVVFAMPERCVGCSGRGVGVSPSHSGVWLGTQLGFSPRGSQCSLLDKGTQLSRFHNM